MKSLQESLFDDDLVSKKFKFGDYYEFIGFNFRDNNLDYHSPSSYIVFNHIKLAQLKKKYSPVDISGAQYGPSWSNIKYSDVDEYIEPIKYIISLINNIELTIPIDDHKFIDEFRKLVKKEVEPYIKDKKISFSISNLWKEDKLVSINDDGILRRGQYNHTMDLLFERK